LTCWEDAVKDFSNALGGSGVIIDSINGYVLTNAHVVGNNPNSTCSVVIQEDEKNPDKQTDFFATVLAVGDPSDFAILKITQLYINHEFSPIPDGYVFPEKSRGCTDQEVKLGDKLVVAGFPAVGGFTITLTEGIVSGFDGEYIKTSAKIEHGNSGGAAFRYSGCFIGIPTSSVVGEIESLGRILRWQK
jgi:serine protease Do